MDPSKIGRQITPDTPTSIAFILKNEYNIEIWRMKEYTQTKYGKRHHYLFKNLSTEEECVVRHPTMAHLVVQKHFGLDIPVLKTYAIKF